jgi:hypothetical protein
MFKLDTVLRLLTSLPAIIASMYEFREIFAQIVATFKEEDQETLQHAYNVLIGTNDAGHRDVQDREMPEA